MQTEEYAKMRALEDAYWWFVSRRRLARLLLLRFSPKAQKVLDLGCGTGAFLAELGPGALGLDFSAAALAFCHERGLENLVHADAQAAPFADGTFDAIVSLDTIEHVPDDRAALAEAFRALVPGGVIVMNVPAFNWLWGPHDVALMHQRRYTRRQVKERLVEAGFKVELLSYSVFFLFPVVVAIRIRDKLKKGAPVVQLPRVSPGPNRGLVILQDIESSVLTRVPLPWGSSVIAVARRPE